MRKIIKIVWYLGIYSFAIIGFVLTGGFFAVKWGWTNVPGTIDQNSQLFNEVQTRIERVKGINDVQLQQKEVNKTELINLCKIDKIGSRYPENSYLMMKNYRTSDYEKIGKMILAVQLSIKDNNLKSEVNACDSNYDGYDKNILAKKYSKSGGENVFEWMNGEQWQTIKKAINKDSDLINRVSKQVGIQPRELVAACIVEQLRLYYTQRELYEKAFKPLSILSNATKQAMGVMSMKEATAIEIENNLKNPQSKYYLGSEYAHLLDFKTKDVAKERFARIANEHNHYYSYLYGAIYLKQYMTQWEKTGMDISKRPEILATLYNIGFRNSHPKPKPQVGGSIIDLGGMKYSFGSLAFQFYYSGELTDSFEF